MKSWIADISAIDDLEQPLGIVAPRSGETPVVPWIPDISAIDDISEPFGIAGGLAYYYVYRGQDGNIDYNNPVAVMFDGDTSVSIDDQVLPPNTIWHYNRKKVAPCCGKLSPASPVCIVAIDENGDLVGSTPNPPYQLTLERMAGGAFRLRWLYARTSEEIAPTGFYIYIDSDGTGFDFNAPAASVKYYFGKGRYEYQSDAFSHGQLVRFLVRGYRTGGGISRNSRSVADYADAVGPQAIQSLYAKYEEF